MPKIQEEGSYFCQACLKRTLYCFCDKCNKLSCTRCDIIIADYENIIEFCKNCFYKNKLNQIIEKIKQIEALVKEFNKVL